MKAQGGIMRKKKVEKLRKREVEKNKGVVVEKREVRKRRQKVQEEQ